MVVVGGCWMGGWFVVGGVRGYWMWTETRGIPRHMVDIMMSEAHL